jgi:hypothetical protein
MKTKSQQFWTLALGLPIAIFLILALAETGTTVPSCGWKFPMWFGCVFATHESLAAGLIATAGAIFAAWLAYSGIQEQILASKSADAAAHEAVRLQLSGLIDTLNQVWRAIDFALTPNLGLMARRNRFTRAVVAIDTLPNVGTLDDVEFGQLTRSIRCDFGTYFNLCAGFTGLAKNCRDQYEIRKMKSLNTRSWPCFVSTFHTSKDTFRPSTQL